MQEFKSMSGCVIHNLKKKHETNMQIQLFKLHTRE